jgi:hypothetical protein
MSQGAFDPLRSLRSLIRHKVDFVLIGGLGARLYGSPTVTGDIDICYERSTENLERLASALSSLDATLRGVAEDVPLRLDAQTLAAGDHFTFMTKAGGLDCLGSPAGVGGFEGLAREAQVFDIDGMTVRVASIEDLIRMKSAAGRPKDRIEVEILEALREEIEKDGSRRGP